MEMFIKMFVSLVVGLVIGWFLGKPIAKKTKQENTKISPPIKEAEEETDNWELRKNIFNILDKAEMFDGEKKFIREIINEFEVVKERDTYMRIHYWGENSFGNHTCSVRTESLDYSVVVQVPFDINVIERFFRI